MEETAQSLKTQLEAHRASDLTQGCTNYGCHRDDLNITVNDMAARSYASQGQKRSCVLALNWPKPRFWKNRQGRGRLPFWTT